jgi:integrase
VAATPDSQTALTISGWWPFWEVELRARRVRPATVTIQRKALTKLQRHAGDVAPAALTAGVIARWQHHMREVEQLKASTVNLYAFTTLTFLRWLVAEGELSNAPKIVRLRESDTGAPELLSSAALAKITAAAQKKSRGRSEFEAIRDAAIITLLQDSGIRASECAGLLVKHLDLQARQVLVHTEVAKAGYARTVCFGSQTARYLSKYLRIRARHDFGWCEQLFVGRRGPATYFLVAGVVRKSAQRGGVKEARAHQFRHSWAHDLKRQGVDTEVLMSLGGWRSLTMVARYGRAERDSRAVERYREIGSPVDRAMLWRR